MKKLLIILVLSAICKLNATGFYEQGGKIYFEKWQVNGVSCWTEVERNEIVQSLTDYNTNISTSPQIAIVVTTITPTNAETNLTTTTVKGLRTDHFRNPTKTNLLSELEKVKAKSDLYNDIDSKSDEAKDYKARYEWLKSYHQLLTK